MLETINSYIKYVYYLLVVFLLIVLIMLLIKIIKINNTLKIDLIGIEGISNKINVIKQKTEYLKQSFSTSWSFFIEIFAIFQIIKLVIRDYKGTPKAKRSMIKSTARSVMHSPKTITKLNKLV